jgi:hypothetical protein
VDDFEEKMKLRVMLSLPVLEFLKAKSELEIECQLPDLIIGYVQVHRWNQGVYINNIYDASRIKFKHLY